MPRVKKKKNQRPPASKVVSLVVSVGPEHTGTMEQFIDSLRLHITAGLDVEGHEVVITGLDASYSPVENLNGEYALYRPQEWEKWDGDPSNPPLDRWAATRATVEKKPPPPRSPREALDDLYEHLEETRGTVRPRVSRARTPHVVEATPKPSVRIGRRSRNDRVNDAIDDVPVVDLFAQYR